MIHRRHRQQVDQRSRCGFWSWGDVVHGCDGVRHVLSHDVGGCAWVDSESSSGSWPWCRHPWTGTRRPPAPRRR
ncbi:exo-rhamnogalacturonan lyase family protein [Kineococcus sp. SYSU DK018]|uniref:exo-rhamnogalacturonan lyase family protein n=1 Tax=Kineococcus sp. SYSU DK018 TaxID=3383139 RepID=UPI003D7C4A97